MHIGKKQQPIAVDLFAGAGGLSEGLLAAGINVAVAVESHPHAALTHAFNHSDTTVLCGDIRQITARQIQDHLERKTDQRTPDIVVGGPPCQGFSFAGKRRQYDPRNKLLEEYVRLVSQLSPKIFVFENVPGLYKLYGGRTLHRLLDHLWHEGYEFHGIDNDCDYYPIDYPIFDASKFGVPQKRRRLILVGTKRSAIDKLTFVPRRGKSISVSAAIGDLAFLSGGLESDVYDHGPTNNYQKSRRANNSCLFNHLASNHRPDTVNVFSHFKPGDTAICLPNHLRTKKQRIVRLKPDLSAPAVLALPDDYIHPWLHRILTVREMARLQSFDDDYVFFGKRTTSDKNRRVDVPQYTQVGNAVPPLLARALGMGILKALGCRSVDLRNLKERKRRHEWVIGSSGFHGYEVAPEAVGQIDLLAMSKNKNLIPINESERPVSQQAHGIVEWSRRAVKQRGRAA